MSWTERQGQVGHLRHQTLEELQELLLRQEKILSNRRLLQTLPDKGKKIREFAEKVRLAIEHHNEEERKQSLVSAARAELQSKYQQAFTMQQRAVHDAPVAGQSDEVQEKNTPPVPIHVQENHAVDKPQAAAVETMETAAEASLNSGTKEDDLVEALERIRISDPRDLVNGDDDSVTKHIPKKPHYVTLLEQTEKVPARKQKFKPNQLHGRSDNSSGSSSARQPEGSSALSAQVRMERDKKHLDDITAARLPPLHHTPAQLLSLQESAVLMREQTKKQQELQAKLAAQKLSEGLKISMGSYTPDGGPMAAYREVHDEGVQLSSEED